MLAVLREPAVAAGVRSVGIDVVVGVHRGQGLAHFSGFFRGVHDSGANHQKQERGGHAAGDAGRLELDTLPEREIRPAAEQLAGGGGGPLRPAKETQGTAVRAGMKVGGERLGLQESQRSLDSVDAGHLRPAGRGSDQCEPTI